MLDFNKDRITEICSQSIFFKDIEKNDIRDFFSSLNYKVTFVKKGKLIIREDDYIDYLGVVLDGEVSISKYYPNGSESLLAKIKSHEVFALDILCTKSKLSFYSAYTSKPSFILKIDKEALGDYFYFKNEYRLHIYENIINYLSNECAKQYHKIEIVSQKSIRDKIINYLLVQKRNTNSNKFKINFDRDQLANFLCVNRSVLSHELSLMQQEGIIKFKKNEFEIL